VALGCDDPTRWARRRTVRGRASPAGKPRGAIEDAFLERPLGRRDGEHGLRDALRPAASIPVIGTGSDAGEKSPNLDGA
jgi:hypothetical protein